MDGGLKRHAGSFSWEAQVGAGAASKVGFHGATPTVQRANANQATAADLASVITLANELRAALVEKGLIKGAYSPVDHASIIGVGLVSRGLFGAFAPTT
jgi:hypothetical protein